MFRETHISHRCTRKLRKQHRGPMTELGITGVATWIIRVLVSRLRSFEGESQQNQCCVVLAPNGPGTCFAGNPSGFIPP